MPDIVTLDDYKKRARDEKGAPKDVVVRQGFTSEIRAVDDVTRTVDFIISTDSIDRSSDSIKVPGWRLDNYRKNPVVLFAHDSDALPVAQSTKIFTEANTLRSATLFADAETYAFADTVYKLVKGRFLRATSVGFMPIRYEWIDNDPQRIFGMDILEQELLEYSIVPIPCNPEALIAASMKGIDISPLRGWAEKILDGGETCVVPRKLLEETFKLAKTPKSVRVKYLRDPEPDPKSTLTVKLDTGDIVAVFEKVIADLKAQAQGSAAAGNDSDGDDLEAGMQAPADKDADPDEEPGEIDQVTAGKTGPVAPNGDPADDSVGLDGDTGGENQDVSNNSAAVTPKDMGFCGMGSDQECGMKDSSKCSTHCAGEKDIGGPSGADTEVNPGITDPPGPDANAASDTTGGPSHAQTDPNPGIDSDSSTGSAHPGNAKPSGAHDGSEGAKDGGAAAEGGTGSGKPDPDAGDPDTAVSNAAAPTPMVRIAFSDETIGKFGKAAPEAAAAQTGGIQVDPQVVASGIAAAVKAALATAMGKPAA